MQRSLLPLVFNEWMISSGNKTASIRSMKVHNSHNLGSVQETDVPIQPSPGILSTIVSFSCSHLALQKSRPLANIVILAEIFVHQ